jgi:hypothetical protein
VEIDATALLGLKFAQLILPPKSGAKADFSAKDLKPETGKTVVIPIELTADKSLTESFTATLRIATGTGNLDAPIEVRRLGALMPASVSTPANDKSRRVGEMIPVSESAQRLGVFSSYQPQILTFALEHPVDAPAGAELRFGIAVEGREAVVEIAVSGLGGDLDVRALARASALPAGIRCTNSSKGSPACVIVEIPALALGLDAWKAGTRICAAAAYLAPAAPRGGAQSMRWGNGIDGGHSTTAFEWLKLAPSP